MSDFDDIVDARASTPTRRRGCAACTTCSCRPGRRRTCRPALERPPTAPAEAEIVQFPLLPQPAVGARSASRRRRSSLLAFGGGYLFGHSKTKPDLVCNTSASCRCTAATRCALLRVASKDSAGNWPMELEVNGLPTQSDRARLLRALADAERQAGRSRAARSACTARRRRVRFSVPYELQALRRLGRDAAGRERPASRRACRALDLEDRGKHRVRYV